jgi:hypothetical protein
MSATNLSPPRRAVTPRRRFSGEPDRRRSAPVQERLERTADAAEADKQRLAVASLSGQQLRAAEVRAKLGGVGGYATPRTEKPAGAPFVLTINFSGGRTQRIEGIPAFDDNDRTLVPPYPTFGVTALGVAEKAEPAEDASGDDDEFDEEV